MFIQIIVKIFNDNHNQINKNYIYMYIHWLRLTYPLDNNEKQTVSLSPHKNGHIYMIVFILYPREHAKKLMLENDGLQSTMVRSEQEAIEIFTLLQKKDEQKNNQVCR